MTYEDRAKGVVLEWRNDFTGRLLDEAIATALREVARETWEQARQEARRIAEVADAELEGCDGDEFIRLNTITATFSDYSRWCQRKSQEEQP